MPGAFKVDGVDKIHYFRRRDTIDDRRNLADGGVTHPFIDSGRGRRAVEVKACGLGLVILLDGTQERLIDGRTLFQPDTIGDC